MKQIRVSGMSCEHCVATATKALQGLGLQEVQVSLETGLATFAEAELAPETIRGALEDAGFEVGEIQ